VVFLLAFIRFLAHGSWSRSLLYAALTMASIEGLGFLLGLEWPEGIWNLGL
jgi:hypothetical protein